MTRSPYLAAAHAFCILYYVFISYFSKFIRLYLSGFTSGERNGTIGPDVGFNNEFDEGNDAIVWPSDT